MLDHYWNIFEIFWDMFGVLLNHVCQICVEIDGNVWTSVDHLCVIVGTGFDQAWTFVVQCVCVSFVLFAFVAPVLDICWNVFGQHLNTF